ncbi:adenylate/guanylate cyclase domain-containing protein [Deinococcus yavapaiensis]|uniref:Class 3 adenylate cyclase n=1 Tax=Deinococcus yavapaiensis KR-236 TaxID=694435 RepID=A0A318S2P6_9DEIO|nr:adenylate/guanylate cyclase domain-containing protein [Deinococcus yavapaiensis]PYE50016.1 class 3 adenylate cyclase [Deinococcus yavapaiensis KR-236]
MSDDSPSSLVPVRSSERHHICALFADVVGSTRLSQTLPLEAYYEVMVEAVQLLILSCAANGGDVLQHQGDSVLALWDARHTPHALEAAFALHDRLGRLVVAKQRGLHLQLHAGVACGEVIFGEIVGARSAYGTPLNLARRLCDLATPGEILLCEETTRRVPPTLVDAGRREVPRGFPPVMISRLLYSPSRGDMKIG